MICPKCKVNLSNESKYCPRCGLLFESDDVKKFSSLFNTDFMGIYFPQKEVRFHIDRVSLGYLMFTYFYAIYKKMYAIAIKSIFVLLFLVEFLLFIFGIGEAMVAILIPTVLLIVGAVYLYFYYIFNFDRLLVENRITRINKILRENEDKEEKELVKIMENDSKCNDYGLLIAILLSLMYVFIRFFVL